MDPANAARTRLCWSSRWSSTSASSACSSTPAFSSATVNSLFGLSIPVPEIALPVGISFFTFQALSYVIDVYRGDAKVQKNYFRVLLYISFFPQLIAGPIVKYRDIDEQIANRPQDIEKIARGLRRFICGLGKKGADRQHDGADVADVIFNPTSARCRSPPHGWARSRTSFRSTTISAAIPIWRSVSA